MADAAGPVPYRYGSADMASIPRLDGRLTDAVVELRVISDWDIPEVLIAHQDDPEMFRRLGLERPPTGAKLGSEVENYDAELAAGRRVSLTIVEPGRNDCCGRIDAHAFDWQAGKAELGVWVAPDYRGRGFARHALTLFSEWLFDAVGLSTVQLITGADNEPLRAAAAAAGFTETGHRASVIGELITLSLARG
jgi:RimJ/RimL family protein N-acetyltransferase